MKIKKKEPRKWTKENVDEQVKYLVMSGSISPVAWWLMASYMYYQNDISLVKDETFDWLGQWLKEHWDTIKHPNKRLIKLDGTFSGYYVKRYPTRVKLSAWQLYEVLKGDKHDGQRIKIKRRMI